MYQNAALLAAFLLIYSAVAGRIERSWIRDPIVFTAIGLLLGPYGLGMLRMNISGEGLRVLRHDWLPQRRIGRRQRRRQQSYLQGCQ